MTDIDAKEYPTIAILGGTGNVGPGLALRWARVGYPVIIGSRQSEKAERIADELNTQLGDGSIRGLQNGIAATSADICVLTVEQTAHKAAIESLYDELQGKILVDTTARVDFRDPRPPTPPSAARMAQNKLGAGVRVVAAFQTVPAHVLRMDLTEPLDMDVMVCSDDVEAARIVKKAAEAIGLRTFYTGNLDNALIVEGLTSLLIYLNKYYRSRSAAIKISGIEGVDW